MATAVCRSYFPIKGTLGQRETVELFLQWTGNGAGAITLTANQKLKGVQTVVRDGAGLFTVTLDNNYKEFLWGDGFVIDATTSQFSRMVPNAISMTAAGGSTVQFTCFGGTATTVAPALYDPLSTETVYVHLVLGRSMNNIT